MNDERYLDSGFEPYGYLPSGEDDEEPIEGEFREFPDEGQEVEDEWKRTHSIEEEPSVRVEPARGTKAQRRAEKAIQEIRKAQLRAKQAQAEAITSEQRKKEWERRFGKYKDIKGEVTKTSGQVSRAFAPAGAPGGAAQFYLGRPGKGLYVPSTPSAEGLKEIPAKRALQPHTERLRRATAPGAGIMTPIARAVMPSERLAQQPQATLLRQPLQYGFLRQYTMPSGTSKLEQAVFAEIKSNGDVDTLEHIKTELARLGYQRSSVERAVRSLEQKGFVEKQKLLPSGVSEYVVR